MKLILKAAVLACLPTASPAEPVIVPSAGSVSDTVQRLTASVEGAGAKVFTVVDFCELQLVIFGDPQIGALALSADKMAALSLPGKVLVYDSGNGTEMAYEVPAEMLGKWDIPSDAPVLQVMADTLDRITSAAAE